MNETNKNKLSYHIHSKNSVDNIKEKLELLGVDNKYDALTLLNLRLFLSVIIFIIFIAFFDFGYILAPLATLIFFQGFIPVTINTKIKKREKKLEKEAVYFFEVLAISLEAGRNIKKALEVTVKNVNSSLSKEFERVLKDVEYGKDLDEALTSLRYRIPSDTVNNIILNIKQSNIFGNNIINTIYQEIDYLREKRLLEAKGEISKIPVKISVVSVVFFIPLLLLLLLGPLIIDIL